MSQDVREKRIVFNQDAGISSVEHGSADISADAGLRQTGIEIVGAVPWGTHFCQFYQTEQDLIDTLVPYFKAGLESNEFCMWVTSEPLGVEQATHALRECVPDLDRRLAAGQIEIIPHTDWYLSGGRFDQQRVLGGWIQKLDAALANGYAGLRLAGNTFWLEKDNWRDFTNYEEAVNSLIGSYRMMAICTYSLDKCGASEVADVVANHEFAILKRGGEWSAIESSTVRQAKETLQTALRELDSRTRELEDLNESLTVGTDELEAANEELLVAETELRAEVNERRKAEEELHSLNRTLTAHSRSSRAMIRATDEQQYLDEVCRIVVEDCGHAMVWIGYAEDDDRKSVRPVSYSGFEEGYLETLGITWADTERGRGPTGTAIRTAEPSMCRNMLTDPRFEPWRAEALKRGYASSIVLPLMDSDKAFGAITIYSRDPDPFSEDEVALLAELASDLAHGIRTIRLRDERTQAEAALRQSEQRLRILSETANRLLLSDDPQGVVQDLCVGMVEHLDCHAFFNYLVDEDRQCLHLNAYAGIPEEVGLEIEWLEYGTAVCGCAARDGCRIIAENIAENYDPRTDLVKSFGIHAYACHPLLGHDGRVIGTLSFGTRSRISFSEDDLSLMKTVADQVATAMERIRLHQAAERRAAELESFVASLADGVSLFDNQGRVVFLNEPGKAILGLPTGESFDCWWALQRYSLDGNPVLIGNSAAYRSLMGEVVKDVRYRAVSPWGTETLMSVSAAPVSDSEGRVVGATKVFRDISDQVEFERHKDDLYQREHHIAQVLQRAIVPPDVPSEMYGYAIAVQYKPALKEAEIGGDFYDIFDLGDGKFAVLIGDVAGKGLPAAIRVAEARHTMRSFAFIDPRPARVMALTNDALCRERNNTASMLTAFLAIIDTEVGTITYSGAGHEPPIVCSAHGRCDELQPGGLPLGVVPGAEYTQASRRIDPGEKIVMVTDGVTEARAEGSVLFGSQGVIDYVLRYPAASPHEIALGLIEAAVEHAGGELQDDAAIVVFEKSDRKAGASSGRYSAD